MHGSRKVDVGNKTKTQTVSNVKGKPKNDTNKGQNLGPVAGDQEPENDPAPSKKEQDADSNENGVKKHADITDPELELKRWKNPKKYGIDLSKGIVWVEENNMECLCPRTNN